MKKLYIKPLSTIVVLNVTGSILEGDVNGASVTNKEDDPNGSGTDSHIVTAGNTGGTGTSQSSALPWGGHAKENSAWDSWDD